MVGETDMSASVSNMARPTGSLGQAAGDLLFAVHRGDSRRIARRRPVGNRGLRRRAGTTSANVGVGSSSWGSADRRATPPTPSTTSANCVTSRPTPRPTTSRSSPPGSTTRDGRRLSGDGCEGPGSTQRMACSSSPWVAGIVIGASRPTWWRPWNWPVSARLRSSPSSGATGGSPAKVADACVRDPTHVPRSGHAPHRGALRSDLAPAGEPPDAGEEPDQVGGGQ